MGNLYEQPWPYVLVLMFVAIVSVLLWYRFRHWLPIVSGFAALIAAVVVFFVSTVVITEREQLRIVVGALAQAVQNNDVMGVLSQISESRPEIRAEAQREMKNCEFLRCWVTAVDELNIAENAMTARMKVTVLCDVARSPYGEGRGIVHLYLDFKKDPDDHWRISNYSYTVNQ